MKKSTILFTLLFVTGTIVSNAQQIPAAKLSGSIAGANHSAINAATVSLLRASDSSVVKMAMSDAQGRYSFENLPAGNYIIQVSAVGYNKSYSQRLELKTDPIEAAPFTLTARQKELSSVTVSARKPMIEQKIDRMVVNVEAFVTNTGANALEALEKSPGVQVDKDGNISLKGKQNVVVMIDGRPSYISGADLANMLRGMQASQIEQFEIMTNPPAKYDAAGNSGIINIKTKKNKQKGFNGNVSAGFNQGKYARTNESISLNYRNGKINLFSNYSFSYNKNFQQLEIYRRYKNNDGSTNAIFEQVSYTKREGQNNNLKIGMDYSLNKKTTLGVVLSGYYNPQNNNGDNTSYLKSPQAVTDSIVMAQSRIKELWKNGSVNLNMRHQFDSTGRELTTDLDYIRYDAQNDQSFVNKTLTPKWEERYVTALSGDLPLHIDIYSGKVDYTHPLKGNARIEAGLKSSYVSTVNKANYFIGPKEAQEIDYGKTNYFNYKENINAAYISLRKELTKKWGIQAGLRFENTNLEGFQYGNPQKGDSSFKRSYNNFFPTVYVSYNANKDNVFATSLGRRIDRPNYRSLNPFMFFIDNYTYGSGNPYLLPQYTYNVELSHIYKGMLTTTLNYSRTSDLFTETFDQQGYATIVRDGNIGRRENMGVSVNANIKITKWWTSMLYANYIYMKYSGVLYNDNFNAEAGVLETNMNNQINLDKGWSAEISGWYRTKGLDGQIMLDPMGQLAAGVAKQMLKGKGTVKLGIRDIFYTQVPHGEINFKSTEARFRNTRDTRTVNVTFTYRFGKNFKTSNGQRKNGSASDEQNRVGG